MTFSWQDDEFVIQKGVRVQAVAVYRDNGKVYIRQEADEQQDDDQVVVVMQESLLKLIEKLQSLAQA